MVKLPKIIWLVIPGVVFILVLVGLVVALSKSPAQKSAQTEISATPSIILVPTPTPASPADGLINKISSLQIEDSTLVAPNFDTKISLPESE